MKRATPVTLKQGNQFLNLILQSGISAEDLQELYESGTFTDLLSDFDSQKITPRSDKSYVRAYKNLSSISEEINAGILKIDLEIKGNTLELYEKIKNKIVQDTARVKESFPDHIYNNFIELDNNAIYESKKFSLFSVNVKKLGLKFDSPLEKILSMAKKFGLLGLPMNIIFQIYLDDSLVDFFKFNPHRIIHHAAPFISGHNGPRMNNEYFKIWESKKENIPVLQEAWRLNYEDHIGDHLFIAENENVFNLV